MMTHLPNHLTPPSVDYPDHPPTCADCGDNEADCGCECCQHDGGDAMCEACCAKTGKCADCKAAA
jgi:hypothetical protein